MGPSLLAAGGFLGAAVALLAGGTRGAIVSALCLGAGFGGVAYLAGGAASLAVPLLLGIACAIMIWLGGLGARVGSLVWLLGRAPVVGRPRVFSERSFRLLLGLGGLLAARLLSGHLGAGTISTQGPAFACLFAWEVGAIRIGTGRGPADLALGALAIGMGAGTFILLDSGGGAWQAAALAAGGPALLLGFFAHAQPWEVQG